MGRKRDLDAVGCLGLVLYWYRTRGSVARAAPMAFGLTATPLYKWIKFGRKILLYAIQNHPQAKVTAPSGDEIAAYCTAIRNKYPILTNTWGAADGLKLSIQQSGNWLKQNYFYNGWTHAHYVNSVFVFAPDGRIRLTTINCPGTWHDSTMADYGIYSKLGDIHAEHNAAVVVDSAFNLANKDFLIKSSQVDPVGDPHRVLLNRAATSVRQLSEHGMRMIQAQFPRLKDPLPYEEFGERKVIVQLMILLYNYQASKIGINEILNSYMGKKQGFYNGTEITDDANNLFG